MVVLFIDWLLYLLVKTTKFRWPIQEASSAVSSMCKLSAVAFQSNSLLQYWSRYGDHRLLYAYPGSKVISACTAGGIWGGVEWPSRIPSTINRWYTSVCGTSLCLATRKILAVEGAMYRLLPIFESCFHKKTAIVVVATTQTRKFMFNNLFMFIYMLFCSCINNFRNT